MYIVILIYGQMVMRSVMEEKISRIAEVIVSSVKPFQLMLGKILGVGAVGLTQLAIWIVLIPIVLMIVPLLIPGAEPAQMGQMTPEMEAAMQQAQEGGFDINVFIDEFFRLNWGLILPGTLTTTPRYSPVLRKQAPIPGPRTGSWSGGMCSISIPV